MQDIRAWLQKPTYEAGVALYQQHGKSAYLKQRFAAGHSPYNQTRLEQELQQIAGSMLSPKNEPPKSVPQQVANSNAKYLQLLKKRDRLYMELNDLMAQKHYLPEGDSLRNCALDILSKHQTLTETWAQIDHYQEHQTFPAEAAEKESDQPIAKQIQLLRQSISKAQARLADPKCRNEAKTRQMLEGKKAELKQLLAKRGADE